jgi:hypothetical protein
MRSFGGRTEMISEYVTTTGLTQSQTSSRILSKKDLTGVGEMGEDVRKMGHQQFPVYRSRNIYYFRENCHMETIGWLSGQRIVFNFSRENINFKE